MKNLDIMLAYLKGDERVPDGMRWYFSIENKMTAMDILRNDVLCQIPKCLEEQKKTEEVGYSSGIEALILGIKYEVFLNSIYALCENLGYVAYFLLGRKLPRHFNEQKKKLLKMEEQEPTYSKILAKTNWYDEVHSMRTESTHYLSGFITITSPTEIGYFNLPKSQRGNPPREIHIKNVEEHVNQIFSDVLSFLSSFGDYFITLINHENRVAQVCLFLNGRVGAKLISLREFLNNEPGICQTTAFECPEKNSCGARKK